MTRRFPVEFSVSAGGCIFGALALLLLPLKLLIAACAAAAIHELSHILALRLFRVPVLRMTLGSGGAVIETAPLLPWQELICAAAGPAGSLLCLLAARCFPLLALCGCIQGLYNLLPIFPMDGGRILRSFCRWCFPAHADVLCRVTGGCTIAAVLLACIFLVIRTLDSFFLLFAAYFLLRTLLGRKIPCKDG